MTHIQRLRKSAQRVGRVLLTALDQHILQVESKIICRRRFLRFHRREFNRGLCKPRGILHQTGARPCTRKKDYGCLKIRRYERAHEVVAGDPW